MPVKWSPDMDQMLLLKILETHDLHVDTKKIVGAWPDNVEKPTPRAIQERLVKIRQNAKANGSAHFPISSTQTKPGALPRSNPATPRKNQEKDLETPSTPPIPSTMPMTTKRKRDDTATPFRQGPPSNANRVKQEVDTDDDIILISKVPFNLSRPDVTAQPRATPSVAPLQPSFNNGGCRPGLPESRPKTVKAKDVNERLTGGMDFDTDDEVAI